MTITATDEKGNTFEKQLKLRTGPQGIVVCLGSPCSWYLEDLEASIPKDDRLYLDAMGRNHNNSPVSCSYKELMRKVSYLRQPV